MASRVRNFCAKNYQNLIIGFHVTVENVGDVFLGHSVVTCAFSDLTSFINVVVCFMSESFSHIALSLSRRSLSKSSLNNAICRHIRNNTST